MQLWTDYEGVTIDGAFPLKKLLLPEGRSAFFSTANGKGDPVVMRLIECHFDEDEILARWRSLESLNHPNFLKLERYGQIEIDGSPVVYAVFEKVDANLAGVLEQGHLSVKDTAQLASSLIAALEVLHTHGFVHDHMSPGNIFAVGDVVKLRSDCIREAPEGAAGAAAKQRDIQDLAAVLLQALTRRRVLEGIPDSALPPPFDKVVRNGMNGSWGLEEIRAAVEGRFKSAPTSSAARGTTYQPPAQAKAETKEPARESAKPASKKDEQLELWSENVVRSKMRQDLLDEDEDEHYFSKQTKWLSVVGLVFLVALISFWMLARSWRSHRKHAEQAAIAANATPGTKTAVPKRQTATKTPVQRPTSVAAPEPANAGRKDWRVIAYTYNRRSDAQKKADDLAQKHPDLQPAVFAPKGGRAPFLVSIGGVMARDSAYALARRARSLGLPRDTYAQNYTAGR